jgi:hypothetical protein
MIIVVDVGFSKVLLDNTVGKQKIGWEILTCYSWKFSIFNNQNVLRIHGFEMFIQNEYAIPNYMTTRVLMLS